MIDTEKIQNFNTKLQEKGYTICCSESITAGLLASTIASVPGASSVLVGSIITYQPAFKKLLLNVSQETLDTYRAESIETTKEMVFGLRNIYNTADIYVAVAGVASASVNEYKINKPVGQIYVVILFQNQTYCFETILDYTDRNTMREKTVEYIFERILEII